MADQTTQKPERIDSNLPTVRWAPCPSCDMRVTPMAPFHRRNCPISPPPKPRLEQPETNE